MARMLSLFLLLGAAFQLCAQAPAFDEYQVKAAFLYNFAKFVEWPPGTFANSTDPIGICIVGQNPFGSALEYMVQGKKVGSLRFGASRTPSRPRAARFCLSALGSGNGFALCWMLSREHLF